MTYFDDVFDRIQRATGRRTQVALAELLDIRQSSISDAKRRNSIPAEWYMKLFEKFGLNPDWLKSGTGPMYLRTAAGYSPEGVHEEAISYDTYERGALATIFSSQVEAGKGLNGFKSAGIISIPSSYAFEGLRVVEVDNAANEPFILKGAYVGIDTNATQPVSGEYFALLMPYEGVVLKKVFISAQSGTLLLRSDNPEYPETSLALTDYKEYMVGKVAWVMQKL